jgi:O-antigen/teichoic acid export membrane protein
MFWAMMPPLSIDPPQQELAPSNHDSDRTQTNSDADVSVALRNAVRLGISLLATWAVALGVRFVLPRYLGPGRWGQYNWAESSAALAFLFTSFGIDTYIQREVSVRPAHAKDFFSTVVVLRGALAALVLAGLYAFALNRDPDPQIHLAMVLFGVTQGLVVVNGSFGALLQASTQVTALARANVTTKLLWGVGVLLAVQFSKNFAVLALPLLLGELVKTFLLSRAVRTTLGLSFKFSDVRLDVAKPVLIACIPFFVNTISYTMGNKLDIILLRELSTKEEVGYYGAAQNIASLALLLAPLEGWVITPLLTRAIRRNEEEFFAILRRAIEGVLVIAIPATMLISFGAKLWMRLATGKQYLPGAASLAQLAPSFVFTYAAVLLATALIIQKRAWTVTIISLSRVALQPVLMWLVVPWAAARYGEGGAGKGDAFVFTFLEFYVTAMFFLFLGRRAFDVRSVSVLLKSAAAMVVSLLAHRALAQYGDIRLLADAVTYAAVILGTRGVRIADLKQVRSMVRNRKRGAS